MKAFRASGGLAIPEAGASDPGCGPPGRLGVGGIWGYAHETDRISAVRWSTEVSASPPGKGKGPV